MPYLTPEDRHLLLSEEHDLFPDTAGELNFCLTIMLLRYLDGVEKTDYEAYNTCMGALVGALLEMYRRRVAVLEDEKIEENGDLY